MNRKFTYPLLVLLFTAGYLIWEDYMNKKLDEPIIEAGALPKATTNNNLLPTSTTGAITHHNFYSLSYSETHEQPEWVAYELKKSHITNHDRKRPYFEVDPAIASESAHWRNYKKSGYDRGHLCPAGDRRFSKEAYNETFLTSNISPQKHEFNAGIWNSLEQKVRYWAKRYNGVYVITGGVLTQSLGNIGQEQVTIPKSFYKIVYTFNEKQPKAIAFLIPHEKSTNEIKDYTTTIDHIESITGIDFFPKLDDATEQNLESKDRKKAWKF